MRPESRLLESGQAAEYPSRFRATLRDPDRFAGKQVPRHRRLPGVIPRQQADQRVRLELAAMVPLRRLPVHGSMLLRGRFRFIEANGGKSGRRAKQNPVAGFLDRETRAKLPTPGGTE
jgi:hypothetical protein